GVVRAEQIAVPVAHLYLPLTRIARSTFRTIVGSAEDVRRLDLVQGDERRLRRVDRLEALTWAESRDGQQPMLVGDVPGFRLGPQRDLEQRHLHHVDHAV